MSAVVQASESKPPLSLVAARLYQMGSSGDRYVKLYNPASPRFQEGLLQNQIELLYKRCFFAQDILSVYRQTLQAFPDDQPIGPLTPLNTDTQTPTLFYKREDLTATGAYKIRGAVVNMAAAMLATAIKQDGSKVDHPYNSFIAVSTGNHALGVIKAAEVLQPSGEVLIYVPTTTDQGKKDKLYAAAQHSENSGSAHIKIIEAGQNFDETKQIVEAWKQTPESKDYFYLRPYDDPMVVAGQGTIGLELVRQLAPRLQCCNLKPEEIVIICPVGGGGLLGGIAAGFSKRAQENDVRDVFANIRFKFVGLRLRELDTRYGGAIRVEIPDDLNRRIMNAFGLSEFQLICDEVMAEGMKKIHAELNAHVEGPAGATRIFAEHPEYAPSDKRWTICIISGGNVTEFPQ